jgi:hypothetical protein
MGTCALVGSPISGARIARLAVTLVMLVLLSPQAANAGEPSRLGGAGDSLRRLR